MRKSGIPDANSMKNTNMKKTLFLTLAVLGVPSVYADTTVLADDLVSKYILKDDGSMSFEYKDGSDAISFNKTITTDKKLTIEVGDGKTVTINGGVSKTSGATTVNAGSIFASQGLEKTGAGDLNIRLNDVNRNIEGKNDFEGDVTVSAGTLTLMHSGDDSKKAHIGGGDGSPAITVSDSAALYMGTNTGIFVPTGDSNGAKSGEYVQIEGADILQMDGSDKVGNWASATGKAELKNVVVNKTSVVKNEESDEHGIVKASSVALYGISQNSLSVSGVDIVVNSFTVNGDAVISDSRVYTNELSTTDVFESGFKVNVTNGSELYATQYGVISNMTVDATSKVQSVGEGEGIWQHLLLTGVNTLEMAGLNHGGIAQRAIAENQTFLTDEGPASARVITYTTDQLAGDAIYAWEDPESGEMSVSTLLVRLTDDDIKNLLYSGNEEELDNVVFTLTLIDMNSSLAVLDTKTGQLDDSMIKLEIKDFDVVSVAGYYDAQTNSTTFRFSNLKAELPPVVPEPATATLSLLALAGLAARRRRKA